MTFACAGTEDPKVPYRTYSLLSGIVVAFGKIAGQLPE